MAETSEISELKKIPGILKKYLELCPKYLELKLEWNDLESCEYVIGLNESTDSLIEEALDIESTLQSIISNKADLVKRLISPSISNAIPVEYRLQEKFIRCCKVIPQLVKYIDANQKKPIETYGYDDYSLISMIEKDQHMAKQYISHGKRFLSEISFYEKNIEILVDFLKKN